MAVSGQNSELPGDKARAPLGVTCEEDGDEKVRICVVIPGVKKKLGKNRVANGNVDVKFSVRSLELTVNVITKDHGTTKFDLYRYAIKRLPDDVVPERCNHRVKKDQIVLILQKAKLRSWAMELAQTGPETFQPEEEME